MIRTLPGPLYFPRIPALGTTHLLIIHAELRTPCYKRDNEVLLSTPIQTSVGSDCATAFAGDEWVEWRWTGHSRKLVVLVRVD